MNDKISLFACTGLTLFFFIAGLLNILENPVIMLLLLSGLIAIIVNIIIVQIRKKNGQKKPV